MLNETDDIRFGEAFMLPTTANPTDMIPGPHNLDLFKKTYLKNARSWLGPDVTLLTAPDGVKFVMKDWSARPLPLRLSWCRIAASREIKVYEKLRGMNGVPQLVCTVGQSGFIMDWLDARPLPRRNMRDLLGLDFFRHLDTLVDEMHERGVAHGDLRRRNILRGVDGLPRLIDFETAIHASHTGDGGRMFQALCQVDRITILKIRSRYFPESVTPQEQQMLDDVPWHLAFGRYLRQNVYGPLTHKGRRKLRKRRKKLH